jgi:penicillin-binding protein 2
VARDILLYALAGGLPPLSAYPDGERAKVQELWSKMNLMPAPAAATVERAKA